MSGGVRGVALLALVVCACGGASKPFGGRVPASHRTTLEACSPRVGTSNLCPSSEASSACATDLDCVEGGLSGSCIPGIRGDGGGGACACVYDRCAADADCHGQGPCQCAPVETGNSCLPGNCAVDADCGVGGFCSPVVDLCSTTASAYECHTPRDTCLDNTDCAILCTFVDMDGRWECYDGPEPACPATALPP